MSHIAAAELPVHKSENKEYSTSPKSKAGLKQQTLLTSLENYKLAVLAISCYTDLLWWFTATVHFFSKYVALVLTKQSGKFELQTCFRLFCISGLLQLKLPIQ